MDAYFRQTYLANAFIFSTGSTAISGTSEVPLLLIQNKSANFQVNGLPVGCFVQNIKVAQLTAAHTAIFNLYVGPTFSAAGTAKTPVNLRVASAVTSLMTVTQAPTVSANGTLIEIFSSTAIVPDMSQILKIVDPNKTLLLTATVSNDGDHVNAAISWFEL